MTIDSRLGGVISDIFPSLKSLRKCDNSFNRIAGTDMSTHLILDLDHTLISSFEFGELPRSRVSTVASGTTNSSQMKPVSSTGDRSESGCKIVPILLNEYKDEFGLPEMYHATIAGIVVLIKLRPFVRSFIRRAVGCGYKLHVYTKGRRLYMEQIVRLIDPEGNLIIGQKISRDDEPPHFKDFHKDPRMIFGNNMDEVKYIVFDDSPQVWSSSCLNTIYDCDTMIGLFEKTRTTTGGLVIAARKYSFSDSFVSFLRTHNRSAITQKYPQDCDDYLKQMLEFRQVVSDVKQVGSPRVMSSDEGATTASSSWSDDNDSPLAAKDDDSPKRLITCGKFIF